MTQITRQSHYEALRKGELVGLKCRDCGEYTFPAKATCNNCGSLELDPATLTGRGVTKTFTVIRVAPEGFSLPAPYIVAMVELEEGPWVTGNLTGIHPDETGMDLIGRQVTVSCQETCFDNYTDANAVIPTFQLD